MNYDFISLHKLGVGQVLVRHSEIVKLEPTFEDYTCVYISTGERFIVEEGPIKILKLIQDLEDLKARAEESTEK